MHSYNRMVGAVNAGHKSHLKINEREVEVVPLFDQVGPSEDTLPQPYGAGSCPASSRRHLHLVLASVETKTNVAEHSELDLSDEASTHTWYIDATHGVRITAIQLPHPVFKGIKFNFYVATNKLPFRLAAPAC